MIIDLVTHVMFQISIATLVFWFVFIPTTTTIVKQSVMYTIDKSISIDDSIKLEKQLIEKLMVLLSQPDSYAYVKNTHVMIINMVVVIVCLTVGFIFLINLACQTSLLPIVFELFVTYSFVCLAQLLFVNFVITNYVMSTETELYEQVSKSMWSACASK